MTNKEAGERLIKQAGQILERDLKGAWLAKDYNMTVRRAQEVVELSLKGVLKILGVDYPKVHDVSIIFTEQAVAKHFPAGKDSIQKMAEISSWLAEVRAPSFYFEKDYTEADAQKAFEDATFVFKEIETVLSR